MYSVEKDNKSDSEKTAIQVDRKTTLKLREVENTCQELLTLRRKKERGRDRPLCCFPREESSQRRGPEGDWGSR